MEVLEKKIPSVGGYGYFLECVKSIAKTKFNPMGVYLDNEFKQKNVLHSFLHIPSSPTWGLRL